MGVGYCFIRFMACQSLRTDKLRLHTLFLFAAEGVMRRIIKMYDEMKRFLIMLCALVCIPVFALAKDVKISVTPSDAKIYIDGNYVGDGVVTASLKKKDGFIVIKCVRDGYVDLETKFFFTDKRDAVSFTMRRDVFLDVSSPSGLVNKYFTVKVAKDLYSVNPDGTRDTGIAWKMIHQVILNYFDEIQTTDMASGFVQTPWQYKTFPEADKQMRTRVSVKESNVGGDLTFQIKVSSEVAPLLAAQRDESFQEIDRIAKDFEPIISEFQARLGGGDPSGN